MSNPLYKNWYWKPLGRPVWEIDNKHKETIQEELKKVKEVLGVELHDLYFYDANGAFHLNTQNDVYAKVKDIGYEYQGMDDVSYMKKV